MNEAEGIIIGIGAATLGALVTYLTARRKNSGKIDTTDAAVLWTESQAMRQELRDQLEKAQGINESQADLIASLTATNQKQARLITKLTETNQTQADIIDKLKERVTTMDGKV